MLFIIPGEVMAEECDEYTVTSMHTYNMTYGAMEDSDVYYCPNNIWTIKGINGGTTKIIIIDDSINGYGYREFYYLQEVSTKHINADISFRNFNFIDTTISLSSFVAEGTYDKTSASVFSEISFNAGFVKVNLDIEYGNSGEWIKAYERGIEYSKTTTDNMEDGHIYNVYTQAKYSYVYVEYYDLKTLEVIKTGIRGIKKGTSFFIPQYLVRSKDIEFFMEGAYVRNNYNFAIKPTC